MFQKTKDNKSEKVSKDVTFDNKESNTEHKAEATRTIGNDISPYTIKRAIDLAESESPRSGEQNTLPLNVA